MLSHLVFVVLFYQAAGFFISLGLVRQSQVGRRYFLYHGLGTVALAVGSYFLLPQGHAEVVFLAWLGFVVMGTVFSLFAGVRPRLAWLSFVLACVLALVVVGQDLDSGGNDVVDASWLFLTNSFLSLLLLGLSMGAMLLGHWYLVQPKLPIEELRRLCLVMLVLIAVRFVFGTQASFTLFSGMSEMEIYRYLLSSGPGMFVLMRWVWGLLGPLALGYFVWSTVRMRSTQSATGLLYIVVLFILTGEILSQYLAFYHGIAL